MDLQALERDAPRDGYLFGRGPAWFAFAMTLGLMVFDYVDRQIVVSLFPHLKAAWGLSDSQLGALVSVVSVTVALGALGLPGAAPVVGGILSKVGGIIGGLQKSSDQAQNIASEAPGALAAAVIEGRTPGAGEVIHLGSPAGGP